MRVLIILLSMIPSLTAAQISKDLLSQFPDSLRPVNPKSLTYDEAKKLIMATRFLQLRSNENYAEIDRLCGKIAPLYNSFPTTEQKLAHVEFVLRYWLNGFEKTSPADSAEKYIEIYGELIGSDTKKYEAELANYYFFKGFSMIGKRRYSQIYSDLLKSIKIFKKKKNYRFIVYSFGLLCYLYRELALYQMSVNASDSARIYIDIWNRESRINPKLLQLVQSVSDNMRVRTFCNMYEDTGLQMYADTAIHLAHLLKTSVHKDLRSDGYQIIARILYRQKDYEGCIAYADSSLLDCCNNYTSDNVTNIQIYKGLSLLRLRNTTEGWLLIKNYPIKGGGPEAARLAGELYKYEKSIGNTKQALYYHEKLLDLEDYSRYSQNLSEIIDAQQKYDMVSDMLAAQRLKEKERQGKTVNAIILTTICFFGLLIGISYRNNKNKNLYLLSQMEELTELQILRIEDEKEKERKRLGQELHGELSGTIAASVRYLRMRAEDEEKDENRNWLIRISDILETGYDKARGRSHELFLEENAENFWKRLEDNIDLFFAGTPMRVVFSQDTTGLILTPEIKTMLLMIIKEAMTNVIKHANASKVEILIYEDLGFLVLEVNDNGRDMVYNSSSRKSVGLLSIEQRLNKVHGKMSISVNKPTGTNFSVKIPIGENHTDYETL